MTLYLVAKCRVALPANKINDGENLKELKEKMLDSNIGEYFDRFTLEVDE